MSARAKKARVYDLWHLSKPLADPGAKPCGHRRSGKPLYPAKLHDKGDQWQVRYYPHGAAGKEEKERFATKTEAERRKSAVEHEMNKGTYVSLDAGNVSFEVFADEWLKGRGADSVEVYRRHLRVHAYRVIGRKTLAALASRPSTVGKWASGIEASANYKRDIMQTVTAVFAAAVDDGLIKRNPMKSRQVSKPKREKKKIVPWTADRVGP